MKPAYLDVHHISKSFGETVALADVDITVPEGESLVLLGPSGCGKTTLLRILAGLERADTGRVVVAGHVLVDDKMDVPPERRRIGMVFQEPTLFPHLTVAGNVAFGLGRDEIEAGRVEETLSIVGLEGFSDRYPETLSGGQAQRVALSRALAPRPRVMLFDEPFSSLDSELRAQVRSEVAGLLKSVGMTSVYVTHDQEEAFVLGDRIAVMQEGRVLQQGRPTDIYRRPISPWVAGFVGEANMIVGDAANRLVATSLGRLPTVNDVTGSCVVLVRPEHIRLDAGDDATVVGVEFYGHDSSYRVVKDGVEHMVRVVAAPDFRPGDTVSLTYTGPDVVTYPHPAALAGVGSS